MDARLMTELWTLVSFSLLSAAILYLVLCMLVEQRRAAIAAIVIGTAVNVLLRNFIVNMTVIALLEPLPVTVAVYASAFLARPFGLKSESWPKIDLAISVTAGIVLVFSATGVLTIDIYRYGYEPLPVVIIALALALLALWRSHVLLSLSVTLSLLLWMLDVASSNFFDHVFHVIWFVPMLYLLAANHKKTA